MHGLMPGGVWLFCCLAMLATAAAVAAEPPRLRVAAVGVRPVAGSRCVDGQPGGCPGHRGRRTAEDDRALAGGRRDAAVPGDDAFRRHRRRPTSASCCARALAKELGLPVVARVDLHVAQSQQRELAANGVRSTTCRPRAIRRPSCCRSARSSWPSCCSHARRLPEMLQPVTVWWAEGREDRITYNRKGRRADGTTYFMREEDRVLVGKDYRGDIDTQAPVVVFKNEPGRIVAALCQFTGHPVTSYHPEKPVVFGDWPQVAADVLAEHLDPAGGRAGRLPARLRRRRELEGDVLRRRRAGHRVRPHAGRELRQGGGRAAAVAARRAGRGGGDGRVPLAPLPPRDVLAAELAEMDDFLRRAERRRRGHALLRGAQFPAGADARVPRPTGRAAARLEPLGAWACTRRAGRLRAASIWRWKSP